MTSYRGRFAPSPTGKLHIGSLTGALASYLDARANEGQWLVRMEDLDPPREMPGAAEAILDSLQAHGLVWDEPVLWQSQRHQAYRQALEQLLSSNQAYHCNCSRSDLKASGGIYPGTCRRTPPSHQTDCAIRLKVNGQTIRGKDSIQGSFSQSLSTEVGDFVLKRRDGMYAYQLAVVVDDAYQKISHCVRGSDLLDSTPRQIYLQQTLKLPRLEYSHIPVITNQQQQKLSKQTYAPALDKAQACNNLLRSLHFLKQPLPPTRLSHSTGDILQWAITNWSQTTLPKTLAMPESSNSA